MIPQLKGFLGVNEGKAIVFHKGKSLPLGNPSMVIHRKIGYPLVSTTISGRYSKHRLGIDVKFINIGGIAYCD